MCLLSILVMENIFLTLVVFKPKIMKINIVKISLLLFVFSYCLPNQTLVAKPQTVKQQLKKSIDKKEFKAQFKKKFKKRKGKQSRRERFGKIGIITWIGGLLVIIATIPFVSNFSGFFIFFFGLIAFLCFLLSVIYCQLSMRNWGDKSEEERRLKFINFVKIFSLVCSIPMLLLVITMLFW